MDTLLGGHFFVNLFLEWSALRYIFSHAYMPISQWRFGPIAKQCISLFLTLNLTFKLFTHSFMPPGSQPMLPQTLIQPWILQRFKLPIKFFSRLFLVPAVTFTSPGGPWSCPFRCLPRVSSGKEVCFHHSCASLWAHCLAIVTVSKH